MNDYRVADVQLADFGASEVAMAEAEMPALMTLREKYQQAQPLKGARIIGCIHMTVQTAVLIDTLVALGAQVRWSSCNRFSTQDHAAAYTAKQGIAVFAWKGESEEEYWQCLEDSIRLPNGDLWQANMLLDDGGDLTDLIHTKYPQMLDAIHGVSEETTTGVHRLHQMMAQAELKIPAIDVNGSVTKSKNDNKYGARHGLNDALKRATDMLLAGRKALVIGYGDVGKGSAASLSGEATIVKVVEIDPICAMQACMDGYEVASPWNDGVATGKSEDLNRQLLQSLDVVVTATGCQDAFTFDMMSAVKPGCVICNIGHFDNEIDTEAMRKHWQFVEVKPLVHRVYRSGSADDRNNRDYVVLLSEGRLVNLGNATGHPSRVMDGSFANQVLAQIDLFEAGFANLNSEEERQDRIAVKVLPRKLDEEVASLMVQGFGGVVTQLTQEQAGYLQVPFDGPYKADDYRY